MFDVGFQELVLLFVIGLLVLGPQKLPKVAAEIGKWVGRARRTATQLRRQLEREIELSEIQPPKQPPPSSPPPPAESSHGEVPPQPPQPTPEQQFSEELAATHAAAPPPADHAPAEPSPTSERAPDKPASP
jgi:sec-independent protein translocase protein TatB